ncbi:hypothetical protein [Actinophytocola algeriensis]|uniref:ElaB/YqjD/DUF883 family membrane-anchored ribosome-binding protein n=1 Tax=Actinophytocola algeriensis TaxID=1768010 RepID=A0A7W7VFR4_9PSEU|nr:hypothetical protein [Actinophytocola algeriensis]MBB4908608.1 ElaB/YqjD/DUF883 family membrane-anchored ribosome-binding protein [Actinophytocola algeriensis]MBE1475005.1 ElaB/YqjD/DUF883 family membrane-anchored ribosome-binding protein [Actinophytocola algeriensis]
MTQQYGGPTSPESQQRSTPEVARDEAADVARTATDKGGEVAGTVGEQASRVAEETKQQARDLLRESREQLTGQARQGQQRAADGLHTLATQLRQMSEKTEEQGVASEVARQVADRTQSAASWLEHREPGDLLDEVRRFARRKPGVFLLGAALAGVAVGRLTRGAIAARSDDSGTGDGRDGAERRSPSWPSEPTPPRHAATPPYDSPEVPAYPPSPVPPAVQTWDPQRGPVNR